MKQNFKGKTIMAVLLALALVMQVGIMPTTSKAADANGNPDPNFHIYIAFGQSNMEGNPKIEAQDKIIDEEHYLMMQTADGSKLKREVGKWYPAIPPLANNNSNLSIADYFGRNVLALKQPDNPNVKVGILVVAVAGASIKGFDKDTYEDYFKGEADWMQNIAKQYGGNPYQRIIDTAKLAQKDGVIKGIIMHQGETDAGDSQWAKKVKKIYDDMIKDLDLGDDIPLLGGQLANYRNQNIAKLPEQSDNFYLISSKDLEINKSDGMNVHFTAESDRIFGRRYAEKMVEVEPKYTFEDPTYEWSADNKKVTAKRVCKEFAYYTEEETVDVTENITKEPTTTSTGTKVYTSNIFKNPAFAVQSKTEIIPKLDEKKPDDDNPGQNNSNVETQKKSITIKSVKCKANTKKITGSVSVSKATVKIKVGSKSWKKAKVSGKKFSLKTAKLKKKTKVTIKVTKKGYKTATKSVKVK